MALRLGHVNVDRMLSQITSSQFEEWRQYARLRPFDEQRADIRAAQIVQAIVGGKLRDHVLAFGDGEKEAETPKTPTALADSVRSAMSALMTAQGGKPKTRARTK